MPEVSAAKAKGPELPPQPSASSAHTHVGGWRDEIYGIDEQGRRQIRSVLARTPLYVHSCKTCQAEDKARMAAPPTLTDAEIDNTLFLIPESDYDRDVARAYLSNRYPNARSVSHQFHAEKLTYVQGARIVVCTRRGIDGKPSGPAWKRRKDEEGKFEDFKIPADTYVNEIVESAPIVVAECMDVVPATMFSEGSVDMTELAARLAEHAYPYRIALPADPRDKMYVMRLNS